MVFGEGPAGLSGLRPFAGRGMGRPGVLELAVNPLGRGAGASPRWGLRFPGVAALLPPRSLSWRKWSTFLFVPCSRAQERGFLFSLFFHALRAAVFWGKRSVYYLY